MANQFLGLSLFIMLLSFFLILNSMSSYEEIKSSPVLNSISLAFSNQDLEEDSQPNIEEDVAESYWDGDTLQKLETLFKAQISGIDAQKNRLGTVMNLRMDVKRFDESIARIGQGTPLDIGEGGDFGSTLVSLLQSEDTIPYRMDLVLNMDENPALAQNEAPQSVSEKAAQAADFAKRLEEAGLPKRLMTSGVGRGPEGTVDIYFRRYQPFDPQGKRGGAP